MTEQEKEIQTITERNITLKLSDADCIRISEKAAAHNITVAQLLENFIGDLVAGTYSNGSDERMYAEQWFERCWFSMFPEQTFLKYLIEWENVNEFIENLEEIEDHKASIEEYESELKKGYMIGRKGDHYTWENLTHGDGTPSYKSREEWETEWQQCIEDEKRDLDFCHKSIKDSWNEYLRTTKEPQPYNKALEKVLNYKKQLSVLRGDEK